MHFVPTLFIVSDLNLIMDHGIMEFLTDDYRYLGIYTIFVTENKDLLPSTTKNILNINSKNEAFIVRQDGIDINKKYIPDFCFKDDIDKIARYLAPIIHTQASESEMPENITLFELYGVSKLSEFAISSRWEQNKAYKTLAVPIGMRSTDDILELNLHEKAHGLHGLVAGTTGSGKSETIQTYIVSLAANFHPYSVAFLLIDYKGGGMANLFEDLPHLVGTITNLDGAQTMRALVAIKSELMRRQEVFSKYKETYDTNEYSEINYLYVLKYGDENIIVPIKYPFISIILDEEFYYLNVDEYSAEPDKYIDKIIIMRN